MPTCHVSTDAIGVLVASTELVLARLEQDFAAKLVSLGAEERRALPRTPEGFPSAARVLANLLRSRPDIAAITHSRADALLETLDAAERLASLLPRLGCLVRRIEDSRSKWLAEALPPTLATCKRALAGVPAESDRHGGMHRRPPPTRPTRRKPSFRKREGRR